MCKNFTLTVTVYHVSHIHNTIHASYIHTHTHTHMVHTIQSESNMICVKTNIGIWTSTANVVNFAHWQCTYTVHNVQAILLCARRYMYMYMQNTRTMGVDCFTNSLSWSTSVNLCTQQYEYASRQLAHQTNCTFWRAMYMDMYVDRCIYMYILTYNIVHECHVETYLFNECVVCEWWPGLVELCS